MSDKLTILRCASSLVMAKTWKSDGTIEPYSKAKTFTYEQYVVNNIRDLSRMLSTYQNEPTAALIRGTPKADVGPTVRRLIENFDDTPLHTVLIEVDSYVPLLSDPLLEPEDAALEYIIECLPAPFHGASFHWQLSNSAGAPGNEAKFKAHLWMWLETPYDSATLRAWAKAESLQLDRAVLQPVQVHYTSLPIFEPGVSDPVTQRSGFHQGAHDSVPLTIDTEALDIRRAGVRQRGERLDSDDPLADWLEDHWETWGTLGNGGILVSCPWEAEHSSGSHGDTSSVYFPAGTNAYAEGAYVCLHNSCQGRGRSAFAEAVGYGDQRLAALAAPQPSASESLPKINGVHLSDPLLLPPFKRTGTGGIYAIIDNVVLATGCPHACGRRLRYDTFRGELVIASPHAEDWRPFEDADGVDMRIALSHTGFEPVSKEMMRDAIVLTARNNRFDTAQHWLTTMVPEWDGVPRIDRFYPDYFMTADSDYTRACGRYVWTAHAGRVVDPGCQVDMVPILVGDQGLLKSSGVMAMSPHPEFYGKIDLDLKDADLSRKMRGLLVGELDELKGLAGRESDAIRAWVTKRHERWTPKFQEYDTTFPRRMVLHGTSNPSEVLGDDEGERRWLPMRVESMVDVAAIERDRLQLWAEGLAMWRKTGVAWQDAERLAKMEHPKFKRSDAWEGAVAKWLDARDMAGETPRQRPYLSTHEVAEGAIGIPTRLIHFGDQKRIGRILRNEGYDNVPRRIDGKLVKVWAPVKG